MNDIIATSLKTDNSLEYFNFNNNSILKKKTTSKVDPKQPNKYSNTRI